MIGGDTMSWTERKATNTLEVSTNSLPKMHSPEDVVNAHDALRLRVAAVVDDRSLRLHPDVAAVLCQHSILTAHCLTFGAHCRYTKVEKSR